MDINFQLKLAEDDGPESLADYKYHLGMIDNPIPFGRFKLLKGSLDRMLEADPEGYNDSYTREIDRLCRILGY